MLLPSAMSASTSTSIQTSAQAATSTSTCAAGKYGANAMVAMIAEANYPIAAPLMSVPLLSSAKRASEIGKLITIIGKGHREAIVSLVERKSKLTRLAKVKRNTADSVRHAITAQLHPLCVRTITSDNGREFAQHQQIAQRLKADFYFAHPYASWERGLNENTNGLVRQYFPKKHDFSTISDTEINRVVERLNNRPRKTLGYNTPNEVFFKQSLVALVT